MEQVFAYGFAYSMIALFLFGCGLALWSVDRDFDDVDGARKWARLALISPVWPIALIAAIAYGVFLLSRALVKDAFSK